MSGQFVLRNQMHLETLGKVWGHFVTPSSGRNRRIWCWWANVGKSINVNPVFDDFRVRRLEKEKINNGYHAITEAELILLWPTFIEDLHNRMVFERLAND